jgi:hypothetical protein
MATHAATSKFKSERAGILPCLDGQGNWEVNKKGARAEKTPSDGTGSSDTFVRSGVRTMAWLSGSDKSDTDLSYFQFDIGAQEKMNLDTGKRLFY